MQTLFTVLALLVSATAHSAVCSRTITFSDGAILTASQLNAEFNAITNCANSLNNANIAASAGILATKIDSAIAFPLGGLARDLTTGGLSAQVDDVTIEVDGTSGDIQVKDGGITSAKIASGVVVEKIQVLTTGTYTVPAGVTQVEVCGWGGGGGGGAGDAAQTTKGAGGGQGAEERCRVLFSLVPGETCNVTIGAGGAGATLSSAPGSAGGASIITCLTSGFGLVFQGGFGGQSVLSALSSAADATVSNSGFNGGGGMVTSSSGIVGVRNTFYSGGSSSVAGGACTAGASGGGAGGGGNGGNSAAPGGSAATAAAANSGAGGGGGSCAAGFRDGAAGGSGGMIAKWVTKS